MFSSKSLALKGNDISFVSILSLVCWKNAENTVFTKAISENNHLAAAACCDYIYTSHYPLFNRKLMKNNRLSSNEFSVGNTVIKLAFVSGALLSCMYGVLMVFASAFKVLG